MTEVDKTSSRWTNTTKFWSAVLLSIVLYFALYFNNYGLFRLGQPVWLLVTLAPLVICAVRRQLPLAAGIVLGHIVAFMLFISLMLFAMWQGSH